MSATGGDEVTNAIVVVVDALRADRVGALGSDRGLTPHLDDLAADGHLFRAAYANANATDPSITSIHTGREPFSTVIHHGPHVTATEKSRCETVDTLPEILQDNGWQTIAEGRPMGRWHRRGFDHYREPYFHAHRRDRIERLLGESSPTLRRGAKWLYGTASDVLRGSDREDTAPTRRLCEAIGSDPFYGFVHLMDTHVPYDPSPDLVDEILARHDYPNGDLDEFFDEHADAPYVSGYLREMVSEADFEVGIARLLARYDGAVREADEQVGQLVADLERSGRLEDTAILVTSDHGESLTEHSIHFDHHGLYEQSIHVPLVVWLPGGSGGEYDGLVQLTDVAPTILDLLSVETSFETDGRSLVPLIEDGDRSASRDWIVANEAQAQRRIAIRTDDWKYIEHVPDEVLEAEHGSSLRCSYCNDVHGGENELYDLATDPGETTDVGDEYPDVRAELEGRLRDFRSRIEPADGSGPRVDYEDEEAVLSRLEDLGYR